MERLEDIQLSVMGNRLIHFINFVLARPAECFAIFDPKIFGIYFAALEMLNMFLRKIRPTTPTMFTDVSNKAHEVQK